MANIGWSEKYECYTIDGVLAPEPLSWARSLKPRPEDKHRQPTPRTTEPLQKPEHKIENLSFRLFKFSNRWEEYILELHELDTGNISNCHVQVFQEVNKKWKVRLNYDLSLGDHLVFLHLEDPNPLIFRKKMEIPLKQRLVGWTVETRERNDGTGRKDKYYYHHGRRFRSLRDMTSYVLYASKQDDLKLTNVTINSSHILEDKEKEAVEAMMIISSSEPHNLSSAQAQESSSTRATCVESNVAQVSLHEDKNVVTNLPLPDQGANDEIDDELIDAIFDMFDDKVLESINDMLGEPKQTRPVMRTHRHAHNSAFR